MPLHNAIIYRHANIFLTLNFTNWHTGNKTLPTPDLDSRLSLLSVELVIIVSLSLE